MPAATRGQAGGGGTTAGASGGGLRRTLVARRTGSLLATAGSPGKRLDEWLRDDFFGQHSAMFHNRPFIWHIWDGRKDGFAVLVNYHKLGAALLDRLIYTYLG